MHGSDRTVVRSLGNTVRTLLVSGGDLVNDLTTGLMQRLPWTALDDGQTGNGCIAA